MLQYSRKRISSLTLIYGRCFLTTETNATKYKERILVSQSSYLQKQINSFADFPKNEKSLHMLMKERSNQDRNQVVKSCQYMRQEFLVRIAKVIIHIQNLPYIIMKNADIERVLFLYMEAFSDMLKQPEMISHRDVDGFNETLSGLLDDHQDIIWLLSKGFHACQTHLYKDKEFPILVRKFMDYMVIHRLCNRILARHHLSINIRREGYVSVVNTELSLKSVIHRNAAFAANVCQNVYMDTLPEVIINGHADTKVAFVPNIIDYVLREILKNAFRATVEAHLHVLEKPSIVCTLCNSPDYWLIRVSDKGNGMSDAVLKQMHNYCYTSYKPQQNYSVAFGDILNTNNDTGGSSLAGFGVGIPVSNAYLKFVQGELNFMTMHGIGTDVYIKIPHLSGLLTKPVI